MTPRSTLPFDPDPMSALPPDAAPPKKKRGRPRKDAAALLTLPVKPPQKVSPQTMAAVMLLAMLTAIDFSPLSTDDRFLLLFFRDISYSEERYDSEFRIGGNAIGPTLAGDPVARNLVDVVLCHGASGFQVVSASVAKDFKMPDRVEYASGTKAPPWFAGIREVVEAYTKHLTSLGLGVKGVCVVIASDGQFEPGFAEPLQAFRDWQQQDERVVVVPAGLGAWCPEAMEKVSVSVKPIHLSELSILDFIRVVVKSVGRASLVNPAAARKLLLAELNGPKLRGSQRD